MTGLERYRRLKRIAPKGAVADDPVIRAEIDEVAPFGRDWVVTSSGDYVYEGGWRWRMSHPEPTEEYQSRGYLDDPDYVAGYIDGVEGRARDPQRLKGFEGSSPGMYVAGYDDGQLAAANAPADSTEGVCVCE